MTCLMLAVLFLATVTIAAGQSEATTTVCNVNCSFTLNPTPICGSGLRPLHSEPMATEAAPILRLNWTLDEVGGRGRLEIDVIAVADHRPEMLLLELEAPPPPACSWSGAGSLRIVYGRTWPILSFVANAAAAASTTNATATKLEVHGPIRLDSLLLLMPDLTVLHAASANMTRPVSGLMRLTTLIAKDTVWRRQPTRNDPPAALLEGLPALASAKFIGGRLGRLRRGDFAALPELRYLYLTDCGVTTVEADAFDLLADSRRLCHLVVEGNAIDSLPRGVFRHLGDGSLVQLWLARNGLRAVDPEAFAGLASLELLDLSQNSLRSLAPATFAGLGRLRTLNLGSNQLLSLTEGSRVFCPLESLVTLRLDPPEFGLDCRQFSSSRVAILTDSLTSRGRLGPVRKIQECKRVATGDWCDPGYINQQVSQSRERQLTRGDASVAQPQPQPKGTILILIIGSISLAHLLVTLAIVALCRRRFSGSRRHCRCSPSAASRSAGSHAVDMGDEGFYSLATAACSSGGCGGGGGGGGGSMGVTCSDSAAAVLVSFHSKKLSDDSENDVFLREKTCYEFDEDA